MSARWLRDSVFPPGKPRVTVSIPTRVDRFSGCENRRNVSFRPELYLCHKEFEKFSRSDFQKRILGKKMFPYSLRNKYLKKYISSVLAFPANGSFGEGLWNVISNTK
ncbi:UNVERIFIED_CONTAM: hypothetical protein NCL1_20882 [Trichonephila clavipes]